eukprot:CAMPEP_0195285338 /NCGR_PEP_ID=MMETSP0707-20130614/3208_1 /TAXON_ID=33640 /ORGANISM="Asterionellopsis glacialis, Strain CCMP134" /LENGTH=319 /DNA_ID=CAMNT_0040344815 /DNA_START=601 /DNA_END=1557 /DNA_ORIENTATION=+
MVGCSLPSIAALMGLLLNHRATTAFMPALRQPKSSSLVFTRLSSSSTPNNVGDVKPLLLTFDLDDTLFPIGPVVQEANDKMYATMIELGVLGVTENDYMSATKAIRQEITSPITYSDLRKRAIATFADASLENHEDIVQQIFDAWLNERHSAAERYLFDGVQESLQELRTMYESSSICIAAITNGRGNPLCMPNTLSSHFDFCVSGEDDGVFPERKPNEGIYQAALARYHGSDKCKDIDNYVWIHVGDCLGNDVGASADLGARAVWVSADDVGSSSGDDGKQKWSTATPSEVEARAKLAEAAKKKASATISSVTELPLV